MMFATQHQLHQLARAKIWYLDGTFKIVRDPFMQLFTVHAFLKGMDGNIKQVPLLFVLMSRRKAKDYKAIFRGLLRNLSRVPSVEKMVADFEKATWKAVKTVFPDVEVQGCVFHWTQAVWRQIQKRGLAGAYKDDRATRKYLGKLKS
eukprot:gene9509-biopygen7850